MSYLDTARALGVCRRRLLTDFVRLGVLPRPDENLTWSVAEVRAARTWLYAQKRGPAPARRQ